MPYSGADDPKLPENVKQAPENERTQWVKVWRSVYDKSIADGDSTEEAERTAFTQANGVLKKALSSELLGAISITAPSTKLVAEEALERFGLPADTSLAGLALIEARLLYTGKPFRPASPPSALPIVLDDGAVVAALPSLANKPVNLSADFSGHSTSPYGHIMAYKKDGTAVDILIAYYEKLKPDELTAIRQRQAVMGASVEADIKHSMPYDTYNLVDALEFTGATVLYKTNAAFYDTAIAAAKGETMDDDTVHDKDRTAIMSLDDMREKMRKMMAMMGNMMDMMDKMPVDDMKAMAGKICSMMDMMPTADMEAMEHDMTEKVPEHKRGMMMMAEALTAAEWTRTYINDLPDSAFAVIEPAYKSGKTDNKNARHLPYKDKDGKIDLPHYRNALARANQIQPVTDSVSTEELRRKAMTVLEKHKKVLNSETVNLSTGSPPTKDTRMDEIELLKAQFTELKQSLEAERKQYSQEVDGLKAENKRQADDLHQILAEKKIADIKLAAQDAVSRNKEQLDPDKLTEAATAFETLIPFGQVVVDAAVLLVACKKQSAPPKLTHSFPIIELGKVGPQIRADHDRLEAASIGNNTNTGPTLLEMEEQRAQALLGRSWGGNR